MDKTITFTAQEIIVLKQLIHLAVQARGMEVAEASVVLVKKLDAQPEVKSPRLVGDAAE